jgi:homeobox-leucine zipper protein
MFQPNMMEGQLHQLDMTQNTSESDIPRIRDEDFDSATKSGSENHDGASGDDQDPRPNKKKRYHRHTQHQIQEMEA